MLSSLKSICRFSAAKVSVKSVAGHKPPRMADHAPGRYAGSLFTAASKTQVLDVVLADARNLHKLITSTESVKEFLKNSAIKRREQKEVMLSIAQDNYSELMNQFLITVIEAGRLGEIEKMLHTYIEYCKILNKEEDIRVISAKELVETEKQQVLESIKTLKPSSKIKVTYEVDETILGGLQIFAGSEFLDCSLRSRLEKLKTEVSKIA